MRGVYFSYTVSGGGRGVKLWPFWYSHHAASLWSSFLRLSVCLLNLPPSSAICLSPQHPTPTPLRHLTLSCINIPKVMHIFFNRRLIGHVCALARMHHAFCVYDPNSRLNFKSYRFKIQNIHCFLSKA